MTFYFTSCIFFYGNFYNQISIFSTCLYFLHESVKFWRVPSFNNLLSLIFVFMIFVSFLHLFLNTTIVVSLDTWPDIFSKIFDGTFIDYINRYIQIIVYFFIWIRVAILNTIHMFFMFYLISVTAARACFFRNVI